ASLRNDFRHLPVSAGRPRKGGATWTKLQTDHQAANGSRHGWPLADRYAAFLAGQTTRAAEAALPWPISTGLLRLRHRAFGGDADGDLVTDVGHVGAHAEIGAFQAG